MGFVGGYSTTVHVVLWVLSVDILQLCMWWSKKLRHIIGECVKADERWAEVCCGWCMLPVAVLSL